MENKITEKELVQFLKENFMDEYGIIDISNLDFGECKGVDISGMKLTGDIYQCEHRNTGDIFQCEHRNTGDIEQLKHQNDGDIIQDEHKNSGDILEGKHKNKLTKIKDDKE